MLVGGQAVEPGEVVGERRRETGEPGPGQQQRVRGRRGQRVARQGALGVKPGQEVVVEDRVRRRGRGHCRGRAHRARGQELPVQVEVGRVPVAGALRGEGRVAALDAAPVHELQVDVLVVGLDPEVVLEDLAAGGAPAWVILVQGHVLAGGDDEAPVLVVGVGDEVTVHIHARRE